MGLNCEYPKVKLNHGLFETHVVKMEN